MMIFLRVALLFALAAEISCAHFKRISSPVNLDAGQSPPDYAGRTCYNNGDPMFCMICNIYSEARGEPFRGKVEIGKTVFARVESGTYPHDVCGVVYQHKQFSWVKS